MPPGIYGSNTAYGTESISSSSSHSNSRKAGYDDSMPTTSGGVCSKKITTKTGVLEEFLTKLGRKFGDRPFFGIYLQRDFDSRGQHRR